MDAAEQLLAIEEIKQLKARYFRCMDTKDWDGFAAVFAPDAVLDVTGETGTDEGIVRGNELIAEYVRGHVDPVTTVHHGHMPEIEITSPTDSHRHLVDGRHAALAGRVADRVDARIRPLPRDLREDRRSVAHRQLQAHPPARRRGHVVATDANRRQLRGLYTVC